MLVCYKFPSGPLRAASMYFITPVFESLLAPLGPCGKSLPPISLCICSLLLLTHTYYKKICIFLQIYHFTRNILS